MYRAEKTGSSRRPESTLNHSTTGRSGGGRSGQWGALRRWKAPLAAGILRAPPSLSLVAVGWLPCAPPSSPCSPSHLHNDSVAANPTSFGARAASRSECATMMPWPGLLNSLQCTNSHVLLSLLLFLPASSILEHISWRSRRQRRTTARDPDILALYAVPFPAARQVSLLLVQDPDQESEKEKEKRGQRP